MNVLYRQSSSGKDPGSIYLENLGVKQCNLKHSFSDEHFNDIPDQPHSHAHYEIYIVNSGVITYDIDGISHSLNSGQFLLLPPQTRHMTTHLQHGSTLLSLSFYLPKATEYLPLINHHIIGYTPPIVQDCIALIFSEYAQERSAYPQIIVTALTQILIQLWRTCNAAEAPQTERSQSEDPRLTLAMQYIQNNIEFSPTVPEVSAYCHISSKQLTRLFLMSKNMTPSEYIRKLRIKRIESMLKDSSLSLHDISEQMHFSSEYYFNAFFKRHAGMPPGEFRKKAAKI